MSELRGILSVGSTVKYGSRVGFIEEDSQVVKESATQMSGRYSRQREQPAPRPYGRGCQSVERRARMLGLERGEC